MLLGEIRRTIRKPKFWVMAFLIGITKIAANLTQNDADFQDVFINKIIRKSILSFDIYGSWKSDISFIMMCFVAYTVADILLDDLVQERLCTLMCRCGIFKFSFCKVTAVFFSAFFCMSFGQIIYCAGSLFLTGQSLFPEQGTGDEEDYMRQNYSDLLKDGRYMEYYLIWSGMFALFGTFLALLVSLCFLWIRDKKFIVVMTVVFAYTFLYVLRAREVSFINGWTNPAAVFTHKNWMKIDNASYAVVDLAPLYYALGCTVLLAVVFFCCLCKKLEKWRGRGVL